ncbi:MAG: hypothetical protein C0434_10200 [Xanthomonadaceae bacterium]|nr:hypothetical protein [Xanthomonadaceae bacterium]
MPTRRHCLFALPAALLLAACGGSREPVSVPEAYIGEWTAPGVTLVLTGFGEIHYSRLRDRTSTVTIEGPLRSFEDKRFSTGWGLLSTTFHIDIPPYQDGLVWRMKIDGIELVRPAEGPAPPEA